MGKRYNNYNREEQVENEVKEEVTPVVEDFMEAPVIEEPVKEEVKPVETKPAPKPAVKKDNTCRRRTVTL